MYTNLQILNSDGVVLKGSIVVMERVELNDSRQSISILPHP